MTGVPIRAFRQGHRIELKKSPVRVRATITLLAACVALNATAFGIVIPVFGRRLGELGYGAADLSLLTGSFALAEFVAAPFLGNLADRIGRKPVIALALASHVLANLGYLVLTDLAWITATRFLQGALEGGMFPAALAVVADVAPARQRGRWLGVVMASFGGAFVLGPVIGGVLFDLVDFTGPFAVSAGLGALGLLMVLASFRESLTPSLRNRNQLNRMLVAQSRLGLTSLLPRPVSTSAILLLVSFTPTFALSYVEPQFIFFAFDLLGWSTVQVGLILFAYGFLIMLMQLTLGGITDGRFERRSVIVLGIIAVSAFYWGMTFLTAFWAIILIAAVSGIGKGLTNPAISAFLLDLTTPHQRASVMGLKTSASSFGAVVGPALAFLVSGRIEPTMLFASAGVFVLLVASIAALGLRAKPAPRLEIEIDAYRTRLLAAGATLRGLALQSASARIR